MKLVKKLVRNPEKFGITVTEKSSSTILIDAGLKAKGGLLAGKTITEICLGGLGRADVALENYDELIIPTIKVYTDHPALSTLGSQLAGWHITDDSFFALGSGPARALALKPHSIYDKIGYKDKSDTAVLVIETSEEPPSRVVDYIRASCNLDSGMLYLILVPTSSIAGSIQIAGRTVETGIYKLTRSGIDPNIITHAYGQAPVLPLHPNSNEAMGRCNDAIIYGGVTYYNVSYAEDTIFQKMIEKSVSISSVSYGTTFSEIFSEADHDFNRVDPEIFAPASMTISNTMTGSVFSAGKVNTNMLKRSSGLHTI